jgi:hypothetical protein
MAEWVKATFFSDPEHIGLFIACILAWYAIVVWSIFVSEVKGWHVKR